ncbi:hypothetical protein [Telluribacter sp.]|uniref:hypothetical protein n=1 Tax=Telluribacter sp. TaxID=1978767 RepID=UPI002E0DB48D|nr:hypothetical protein [Telluribacter sp.]
MKKVRMIFASLMIALFLAVGTSNVAQAQKKTTTAEQVAGNLTTLQNALIAANIQLTNVTIQDVITIGDITVTDVVDVQNVLNNANIEILNGLIVDIQIDNVLNNLLREADIINDNQIVVGILSGQVLVQNVNFRRGR